MRRRRRRKGEGLCVQTEHVVTVCGCRDGDGADERMESHRRSEQTSRAAREARCSGQRACADEVEVPERFWLHSRTSEWCACGPWWSAGWGLAVSGGTRLTNTGCCGFWPQQPLDHEVKRRRLPTGTQQTEVIPADTELNTQCLFFCFISSHL